MRKVWCWLLAIFMMNAGSAFAANLEQTTIRLERTKAGQSPLPVLVMVESNSLASEDGFRLRVPDEWQVETNATLITTRLTGLPSGVMAWPGMGSASAVTGHLINFPSGNLTSGVVYGFYITGGIGANPSAGGYKWLAETIAGGSVADQMEIKVATLADDTIAVTGKVGAMASDFQLEMTADKTGYLSVDEEITFQINYGSYLQNNVKPLKISAEWSRGTVSGSPSPSVDIADYVVGSGTTAYGEIEAVVDLVNRKIEWTIPTFPANTINQKVEFKLRINNSYSGYSNVSFDTTAYLRAANVVTMSTLVNNIYKPLQPTATLTPTLTLTPTPTVVSSTTAPTLTPTSGTTTTTTTSSPTSTPTPTVLPTPTPTIAIKKIEIVALSSDGIKIQVDNNIAPGSVKIKFGNSMTSMTDSVTSINQIRSDVVNIDGLVPGEIYYFRVEVTDAVGKVVRSDVYTFKTADTSVTPEVVSESIIVTASNNILLDTRDNTETVNSVVIIPGENYAFKFNLDKPEIVRSAKIYIRNNQVLGINSVYAAEQNSSGVDMTDVGNGGFIGQLVSPTTEGYFDIVLRIDDTNGNISEKKIGQLRVILPLTVVDRNGQPIENAKVTLYRLDQKKNIFEILSPSLSGIKNPNYTGASGQLPVILPKGNYRVEAGGIGYLDKRVDFSVGLGLEEKMPRVALEQTAIGIPQIIQYFSAAISDDFGYSKAFLAELTISSRFFRLMAIFVLLVGVIMMWMYYSYLIRVEWWLLPIKIVNIVNKRFLKNNKDILRGTVVDRDTGMPVNKAVVYLLDEKFNKVLSKGLTDRLGNFSVKVTKASGYRLAVIKDGFEPSPMMAFTVEGIAANDVEIKLTNIISRREKIEAGIGRFSLGIRRVLLSSCLLGSLILELIFWRNFGLKMTWPWVVISWLNMGLWLVIVLKPYEEVRE
jgi:hypothetical protein